MGKAWSGPGHDDVDKAKSRRLDHLAVSRKGRCLGRLVPEIRRGQPVPLALGKWFYVLWTLLSWRCSFSRSTDLSGMWPSCDVIPELSGSTLPAPQTGPDFSVDRTREGIMMTGEPCGIPLLRVLPKFWDSQA